MAQVLVHLDDEVLELLRVRAKLHGHSLEQEVREILMRDGRPTAEERIALADEVRRLTAPGPQSDSTQLVREDRDRTLPVGAGHRLEAVTGGPSVDSPPSSPALPRYRQLPAPVE